MHDDEQRRTPDPGAFYAEDRSAIRWPYYFHATLWGIVLAGSIAGVVLTTPLNPNWSVPITAGLIGTILSLLSAFQNWPVGIRVGNDGIRIGGVSRTPKPDGKPPLGESQRKQLLYAPWSSVRTIALVTDRRSLRQTRALRGKPNVVNRVGVLWGPFTRAALLIEVDPARVVVPDFREPPAKSRLARSEVSPVWWVPTRRPDELRDALRTALSQEAPDFFEPERALRSSPSLPDYLKLILERADVATA